MYVLYHAECDDGFGAAWAVWKRYPEVIAIPVFHGQPFPEGIANGQEVWICDFSYPKEILLEQAKRLSLWVLDHHWTAEEALKDLPFAYFDMDKSGAVLTWERFHPEKPVPMILQYVQDRDLWRKELVNNEEVTAFIRSYPQDFSQWDRLNSHFERGDHTVVHSGGAIIRYQQRLVERAMRRSQNKIIGGYRVVVANVHDLSSEVCEAILKENPDLPFSATYFDRADGKRVWSLRSRGSFNVGNLARQFGGGGHHNAAGFVE